MQFVNAQFERCIFQCPVDFTGATFNGESSFCKTKFYDRADFSNSIFKDVGGSEDGPVTFRGAVFQADALFDNVEFSGDFVNFRNTKFSGGEQSFVETRFKTQCVVSS